MKLLRIGAPGRERPVALLQDGRAVDLSGVVGDAPLTSQALANAAAAIGAGDLPEASLSGERIGSPLPRPGKVVCIGLNYRDHAAETGAAIPEEPIVFLKAPYTVVGPDDEVLVPRASTKTDYEVELGVVIGTRARYLASAAEGLAAVAGYVVSHDVSEREFQLERGGQWDKGKNCETFNPLGPWFVTADEVGDPGNLGLRLWVNGELRQDGSTKEMVTGIGDMIAALSRVCTLEPGEFVATGTPGGVGVFSGRLLRPGQRVRVEIEGIGAIENPVVAEPSPVG
jgi:2-keto-4-pentenoate hydratase/2-oxohepta-3-ene-1,7-dioic acid hydratase in catechol pathway